MVVSRFLDALACFLASGLYLSHIPARLFSAGPRGWTGAGLLGTLWGLALLPAVPEGGFAWAAFFLTALAVAIAVSSRAERAYKRKDDPRIVIDETLGYWAAVAFLPRSRGVLLAGFILFRLLDSAKPPFLMRLERLPHGFGIVLDDVGAGVLANLILQAALRLGAL